MAKAANVRSLEALKDFRVALIKFIDKAKRAVATSDAEVMRTQMWLDGQQSSYWAVEIRKAEVRLANAKSELFRASISQPDNPRGPTDQVRLVRKRKAEIAFAKRKLDSTKRWARMFEHNSNEYKGAMSPLSSALDGSAQKTVVLIERSIATLESYLAPAAPKLEESPNDQQITSIARKGEEKMEPTQDEHADSNSPTD